MEKLDKLVLGAGLTGLSFAYHYDRTVPIYEKNSVVGGLVRTIHANGYRFDLAPHLLHLRSDYVKNLLFKMLGLRVERYIRKASIYYDGRIIPYPFELSLYGLSDKVKNECLKGLEELEKIERDNLDVLQSGSYEDYALRAFGSGIANHYLLPYTRKVWDTDPSEMTCEWMRFLPTAKVEQIKRNANQPNNDKFGYNSEFYYPSRYGIQELANAFAKKLSNIHLNEEAFEIDTTNKMVSFVNGKQIHYETLISTLPLRDLVNMTDLKGLKELAGELKSTSVYTINVVVTGKIPEGIHWMYFPDSDIEFYRISFPKNYFLNCTPNDEQIIAVEVGSRDNNLNIEKIRQRVVKRILVMDVLRIDSIVFTHCVKIPVGYCIYDKKRTKKVQLLTSELNKLGVECVGRYGQWEYSAMEDAILYGKNLALKMRED